MEYQEIVDTLRTLQGERVRLTYPNSVQRTGIVSFYRDCVQLDDTVYMGELAGAIRIERMERGRYVVHSGEPAMPPQSAAGKASFAAFKRRVAAGTVIDAVGHYNPGATGRRTVTKAQGNGFFFVIDGDERRRWVEWPKASEVVMHSADSLTLCPGGVKLSTLTIAAGSA